MVRYQLHCEKGHGFEAWFSNSASYDVQVEKGLVTCPHCGSSHVSKALMAPNVQTSRKSAKAKESSVSSAPVSTPPGPQSSPPLANDKELRKAIELVRTHVEKTADYVGKDFAEEARKIHYKESEKRAIYGEASGEDLKELSEEGIGFLPLPEAPSKKN